MTDAIIIAFPRPAPRLVVNGPSPFSDIPPARLDTEMSKHRQRIHGRWCKHETLPNRQGFVDAIARVGGDVMALLSNSDGTCDWFDARLIGPATKPRDGGTAA